MRTREMPCLACTAVRAFEQPPCGEGHEPACPEWICTSCGTALLIGPAPVTVLSSRRRRATARGHDRRAA